MPSFANWQTGVKHDGSQCYVPVRRLSGGATWGRIGQTQITKGGVSPPRPYFIHGPLKKHPSDSLLRTGILKRSMSATSLVAPRVIKEGYKFTEEAMEKDRHEHRSMFYSQYAICAGRDPGLRGPDIILGANHQHYSPVDQMDVNERNGRYKRQRSVPDRFMMDENGNYVPWVAAPLSDSRSVGNWVVKTSRFFVRDEMEEDATVVPDPVVIHRVGRYYFKI